MAEDFTLEDIDAMLTEIDNKYSNLHATSFSSPHSKSLQGHVLTLARDFDSLGLPAINFNQPFHLIFEDFATNAIAAVGIHRRTLKKVQDLEIMNRNKESINRDLAKQIANYKKKLIEVGDKELNLHSYIRQLENGIAEFQRKEVSLRKEIKKINRFHEMEEAQLKLKVKKLEIENNSLQQLFGKDFGKYTSRDEATAEFLMKYKKKEKIYDETVEELTDNIRDLTEALKNCQDDMFNLQKEHGKSI